MRKSGHHAYVWWEIGLSEYVFDQSWSREQQRLDALAGLYDEGSIEGFTRLGVGHGWRCLEVGAGTGTLARWLRDAVGPNGYVLATDLDTRFVEAFASLNLETRTHDVVSDPLPECDFDLVHARAVLEHLSEREAVLQKLIRAVRPGGWVFVEDVVFAPPAAHPEMAVNARLIDAFAAVFRARGADPDFGLKLPRLFAEAGLVDTEVRARVPIMRSGSPSAEWRRLSLEQLGPTLVADGLLNHDELELLRHRYSEVGTAMLAHIMVAAAGKRP